VPEDKGYDYGMKKGMPKKYGGMKKGMPKGEYLKNMSKYKAMEKKAKEK
jgi:hypothetical protein